MTNTKHKITPCLISSHLHTLMHTLFHKHTHTHILEEIAVDLTFLNYITVDKMSFIEFNVGKMSIDRVIMYQNDI